MILPSRACRGEADDLLRALRERPDDAQDRYCAGPRAGLPGECCQPRRYVPFDRQVALAMPRLFLERAHGRWRALPDEHD
jgi:hypothetical protein